MRWRRRWPWRLLLAYFALVSSSLVLLLARPGERPRPGTPSAPGPVASAPAGARQPAEPGEPPGTEGPAVIPVLAGRTSDLAADGASGPDARRLTAWAGFLLRLGLPLLDAYDATPLRDRRGSAPARVAVWHPLRLLRAQVPVLALTDPEAGDAAGTPAETWTPLPLPYVAPDTASALGPPRPLPPPERPLVIVYHTHAHESFLPSLRAAGLDTGSPYTDDERLSVVRVGEELARALQEEHGIPALHLRTPFDANGLTGSYMESERGLREAMARYPSATVLLDVHRDSSGRQATVTVVGGKPVARVLFVVGQGNRHLPNPHWERNQAFGRAIARALDAAVTPDPLPLSSSGAAGQRFPPLVRQLADGDGDPWTYGREGRFNQHLSERAILIEIGGPENTVVEAVRTARLVARAVAEALR